jgi:amino acid adenylation domain-containing protein
MTASPSSTPGRVRDLVATALSVSPDGLGPDDNLYEHGLDSLTLIRLSAQWRREGRDARFEELAAAPTLSDWERLLDDVSADAPTAPSLERAPEGPFPLATLQHAYWLGRDPQQPYGGVAPHFYAELDGSGVDPERLDSAVRALFARHDLLRMRILPDGRGLVVDESPYARLIVHDLRDEADPGAVLERTRQEYTHRAMDIESGQVFEIALSLLPEGRTRLHVDLDMVAADAISMRVLLDDLRHCYENGSATGLPPLTTTYADYLHTRSTVAGAHDDADREWWQVRLDKLPSGPALPIRRGPHDDGPAQTRRLHHFIGEERLRALTASARANGTTPAAALAAVFAESIGPWCANRRFLLNLPLFDREPLADDVVHLVGDFSGSVLVDIDLDDQVALGERARRVGTRMNEAIGHASYSGVEVLRDLTRRRGETVLAPVVYTNAQGLGDVYDQELQRCFGAPVWIVSQGPQVWLDAQVTELDGGLLLNWDVRDDVLEPGVADAAFDRYRALVDALIEDPAAWGRPAPSGLPSSQRRRREAVNATRLDLPGRCLHTPLFAHAETDPDRPALGGETTTTYGELARLARSVAGWLHASGARRGDAVAIALPKGADQIVAALGVLAAGCCYVPIAPHHPSHRIAHITRLAAPVAHLTPDTYPEAVQADPIEPVPTRPDDPAYVLFTSGSTGEPKGVEVSHAAAANTIDSLIGRLGIRHDDATIALSAFEFDMSVFETFAPLAVGGRVVVVPDAHRDDPASWARLVRDNGVTIWNSVPALLALAVDATVPGDLAALRAVLLGGDIVAPDLPQTLWGAAPRCRVIALGGMTEAAIHSTWQEITPATDLSRGVPWGTPLDNVVCRVVDDRGDDRPDYVAGELWVGGSGLARGYRNAPELTSERFVEAAGQRWYRTGDLARYRDDGVLEFTGRDDGQVQVHGFRIELGEIEAVLRAHPDIADAMAFVVDRKRSKTLAAVVVPRDPASPPDGDDLVAHQTARLPDYMVCRSIQTVTAIPLSSNGKVRRSALAATVAAPDQVAGRQPRTDAERLVARVWTDLVQPSRPVTADDTFLSIGGDSLLATRAVAALRAAGAEGASVARLIASRDLATYAAGLTIGRASTRQQVVAHPEERHEPFLGTDVQEAYRIGRDPRLPLGGVGTWQYAEFDGPVDPARLERAWTRLIARHEMLRSVFTEDGRIRILEHVPEWSLPHEHANDEAELLRLRERWSHHVTDLTSWPLWDVRLVDHPRGQRLLIGVDYILFDALSIMTLFTELNDLYNRPDRALEPIEVSFRDYLEQLDAGPLRRSADEEYWRSRLAELPPGPALPLRAPLSELREARFHRRSHRVSPENWNRLQCRAREDGVTVSTLLLALYADVLGRWSESAEITVTLTMFNRREVHPHIYRVLGDFTAVSLADYRPRPEGLTASLRDLQQRMAEDLDHRDVSSTWLLRELSRRRGRMESVPVVFTSGLGVADVAGARVSMDTDGAFPARGFGVSQSPQVTLDNQVTESSSGLLITWDSVDEAFAPDVVEAMFDHYVRAVESMAADGPSAAEHELTALPPEQAAVRRTVNDTAIDVTAAPLHAAFLTRAEDEPDAIALTWWEDGAKRAMTRGELAARARRVAQGLVGTGVHQGDRVGVRLDKGPDQVVATFAVLIAGAAYVPLGRDLPAARTARIRATAGLGTVIDDLGAWERPASDDSSTLPTVDADAVAYVIFTSGSTGDPKGVEITHAAAHNTIVDVSRRCDLGQQDAVLAISALDFDLSVWDLFGVLGAGGRLVLPGEHERRDAQRWVELMGEESVTVWNSVPMLLEMLLTAATPMPGALSSLRVALVSGDWVALDLATRLRTAAPDARLMALGGATEAGIWSNVQPVDEVLEQWASVPYGRPLANQRFRVVDGRGLDRPDWVAGELLIGGRSLAVGYLDDDALTADRFVRHGGERWYRTGDTGRYWPDGTLEFLGRVDTQVKVSGHRIELGDVEAAMRRAPGVENAVALIRGAGTEARVHGFVAGREIDPAVVQETARAWLPAAAVPVATTMVDALPLTASGKIDRRALVALVSIDDVGAGESMDPAEEWVAAAWSALLQTPVVSADAGFFSVGGNSLAALRFVDRVREEWRVELPVRALLERPDLASVAEELRRLTNGRIEAAETYEEGEL